MNKLRQIYEILIPQNIRSSLEKKVPIPSWAILLLIIALVLLGIQVTKAEREPILGLANSQPTHIMVGPGVDYRIIEKVSYGSPLLVVGEKGEWFKIKTLKGEKGWAEKERVKIMVMSEKKEPPKKVTETKYETRYVKMDQLNVRSGPGVGYKIIGKVVKNEAVGKVEVYGSWCKIKTSKGIIGWVSSKYLSVSKVR